MQTPSEHLLRSFASVSTDSRVLELGCRNPGHAESLAQLGLEMHACSVDQETVASLRESLAEVIDPREALRRVIRVNSLDALGYPDDYFDWIVAYDAFETRDEALEALREARRVLKPGGWIYVAMKQNGSADEGYSAEDLTDLMQEADFEVAEAPAQVEENDEQGIHGIFRRVEEGTPA